jgi:signal transduction histidine kinase
VALEVEPTAIRLTVEDDGVGMAGRPLPRLGLLGMQERLSALAGHIEVTTAPGAGFRLEATIPRSEDA